MGLDGISRKNEIKNVCSLKKSACQCKLVGRYIEPLCSYNPKIRQDRSYNCQKDISIESSELNGAYIFLLHYEADF